MNPQKVLAVLFAIIDAMWDMGIREWLDFKANLNSSMAHLNRDEKIEVIHRLHQLNLRMGTKEWSRRLNVCIEIHELI